MDKSEFKLATFGITSLRGMGYDRLKFLCNIWGLESVYKEYRIPHLDEDGHYCKGYKEEIVIQLRLRMRQEENKRRAGQRAHVHIETPEYIRPHKSS